jgi:hypothetical protein
MNIGNGVSRGDRNRHARLGRLRELVAVGNAIVGIDLADTKYPHLTTRDTNRLKPTQAQTEPSRV